MAICVAVGSWTGPLDFSLQVDHWGQWERKRLSYLVYRAVLVEMLGQLAGCFTET